MVPSIHSFIEHVQSELFTWCIVNEVVFSINSVGQNVSVKKRRGSPNVLRPYYNSIPLQNLPLFQHPTQHHRNFWTNDVNEFG